MNILTLNEYKFKERLIILRGNMKVKYKSKKKDMLLAIMIVASITLIFCSSLVSRMVIATVDKDSPIYSINTREKKVALTIDFNWNDNNIDSILNTLDTYKVNTTLFVMGNWCDKYPTKIKDIANTGHEIGNLSNKYPNFTTISKERIEKEVQITNGKILDLTGKMPTLFRFPEGKYNDLALETVMSIGLNSIQWNVDSKDWENYEWGKIDKILKKDIEGGDIILLHSNDKKIVENLPKIIESLQSQGYEFIRISDLIYNEGYAEDSDRAQN